MCIDVLGDQQPGRHERDVDALVAQPLAERPEVAVQQRLAAGQHDALHVERAHRRDVTDRARRRSISRVSAFAFQMSHITQRQLHALCTLSARIGSDSSAMRPAARRAPGQLRRRSPSTPPARGRARSAEALATRRATQRASRRVGHRPSRAAYGCRRAANTCAHAGIAHERLAADHRQAHVRARAGDQRLERVGRAPAQHDRRRPRHRVSRRRRAGAARRRRLW